MFLRNCKIEAICSGELIHDTGTSEADRQSQGRPVTSGCRILQPVRRSAVPTNEIVDIESVDPALFDHPLSADHDPICLVSTAQYKGGQRVASTGEAKLVQLEECEVGDLAGSNFAELRTADAGC
jgi:hypothetical protein